MQPAQQKLQSLLQEPALGRTANAMTAEATALTGLLPACVPKYVTDLVIPAPMPVSLVPLRKVGPLLSVGASLLLTGITQSCAMGALPVGQHMSTHINSMQRCSAAHAKSHTVVGPSTNNRLAVQQLVGPVGVCMTSTPCTLLLCCLPLAAVLIHHVATAACLQKAKLRRGTGSTSYDDSEEDVKVDQYELPPHLQLPNSKDLTELQRQTMRLAFSATEGYYQQKHDSAVPPQSAPAPEPAPETQAAKKDAPAPEKATLRQNVVHSYDVSVRQIQQNVLPPTPTAAPGCPASFASTTVLAYGPANVAGQPFHNWPGFSIEAQVRLDGYYDAVRSCCKRHVQSCAGCGRSQRFCQPCMRINAVIWHRTAAFRQSISPAVKPLALLLPRPTWHQSEQHDQQSWLRTSKTYVNKRLLTCHTSRVRSHKRLAVLCSAGAAVPSYDVVSSCLAAQRNVPTRIQWTNDLKDASGAYLPHILRDSIDQTIHWANPAVSVRMRH
jgi:hypothetical protein